MGILNLLANRIKIVAGLFKYQKTGKPKPIFAHLLLTNRCNLDCRYCFVDVNTIHKSDLQLEEWKNLVAAFTRALGCSPVITLCSIVPNSLQATQSKSARLSQAFWNPTSLTLRPSPHFFVQE